MHITSGRILSKSSAVGGFTLIELLVVISIISLLVSILLPVLKSARDRAITMRCASQTRQLGLALNMYSNDWKLYYPLGFDPTMTNANMWRKTHWAIGLVPYMTQRVNASQIYTQTPDGEWWFCPTVPSGTGYKYPSWLINHTISGNRVADAGSPEGWKYSSTTGGVHNIGTIPKQITVMKKPSQCVALAETNTSSVGFDHISRLMPDHANNLSSYRHKDSNNMLFFDSHVSLIKKVPGNTTPPPGIAYYGTTSAPLTTRKVWE